MATIRDISKACGVSPATVSKALNGYDDVSNETVELVKRTAERLHYMPNAAARLLKTNTSHNIGVLFIDDTMSGLTHEYFSLILNGVKNEAEELGYDITFINSNFGKRKLSYLQHCIYRNFDGVIIASVDFTSPSVRELVESDVPVVTIDYSFENTSSVASDNYNGTYQLLSYLADRGHRKIAFIHGEPTLVTGNRIRGFREAAKDRGISIPEEYMTGARYHDGDSVGKATARLLDLPDPPTAIMFPDDFSFMGGQAVLRDRGLSIPDDISVCGYDGINLAKLIHPQLTTWYQDADRIGRTSARKLVETVEMGDRCKAEQIMVSGRLLEGCSVKNIGNLYL